VGRRKDEQPKNTVERGLGNGVLVRVLLLFLP
jgi:hypothetical protein